METEPKSAKKADIFGIRIKFYATDFSSLPWVSSESLPCSLKDGWNNVLGRKY